MASPEGDFSAAPVPNRRPIDTRSARWVQSFSRWLVSTAITPNQISVLSVVITLAAVLSLFLVPGPAGLVLCATGIQLRLLCNLMDGLVAVEGGKKSALGDIYNEVPDRISDALTLVALGYFIGLGWLGWLAALLAVATAYIRMLGGALGLPQDFRGPMAKSHRMATMTAACLLGAIELKISGTQYCLWLAAVIITAGSLLTCGLRLRGIAHGLKARAGT